MYSQDQQAEQLKALEKKLLTNNSMNSSEDIPSSISKWDTAVCKALHAGFRTDKLFAVGVGTPTAYLPLEIGDPDKHLPPSFDMTQHYILDNLAFTQTIVSKAEAAAAMYRLQRKAMRAEARSHEAEKQQQHSNNTKMHKLDSDDEDSVTLDELVAELEQASSSLVQLHDSEYQPGHDDDEFQSQDDQQNFSLDSSHKT